MAKQLFSNPWGTDLFKPKFWIPIKNDPKMIKIWGWGQLGARQAQGL